MDRNEIQGEILIPIAGTTRWQNGYPSGVWGKDVPCIPHVRMHDGQLRPMTRNERRWLARMEKVGRS